MGFKLGEFGTSEDETEVPIGRDWRMFRSLREETDGSVLMSGSADIISEAFSE